MTNASENERLAGAIEALTDHVSVLRVSIDEFRSAIQWGLENDKFQNPPTQIDTDDIASVIQETIHEELSVFDESLNQFSIDMQWAVRQVREASESVKTQLLLFSDTQDR